MVKNQRNFMYFVFLTLCSYILICTASPLRGEKVETADADEFPFIVSLSHFKPSARSERYRNHFCGGSLITKTHVLTVAHCIKNKNPLEVVVTVGNINLNEGKWYTVKSWITYDDWAIDNNILTEFPTNDIAVVTLSKEVVNIVPAIVSKLPETKIYGRNVVTAGWGLLSNNSIPQFLQKASLRVLTPKECERNVLKLFGTKDAVPHNHYCTAAELPLITGCGDSGSPLLLKGTKEIVGVNEAACEVENAHTHPYATSIHVKVNYFKEFIDDASK